MHILEIYKYIINNKLRACYLGHKKIALCLLGMFQTFSRLEMIYCVSVIANFKVILKSRIKAPLIARRRLRLSLLRLKPLTFNEGTDASDSVKLFESFFDLVLYDSFFFHFHFHVPSGTGAAKVFLSLKRLPNYVHI